MHEIEIAHKLSTAESEAAAALREIREHGAYLLIDINGCIHIQHSARVPDALMIRLASCYTEAVRMVLGYLQ